MDKHRETYREEAYELLGDLESGLLELETSPGDMDVIGQVFRALHTIKGSGAMFGFDEIAAFAHDVENVFEMVRNGEIGASKELVSVTLDATDHIRRMLDASATGEDADRDAGREILLRLHRIVREPAEPARAAAPAPRLPIPGDARLVASGSTYRIRFKPPRDIFLTGTNPLYIIEDLRKLGRCYVIAHVNEIPNLSAIDPEICYTHWDILLTTSADMNEIKDAFLFVEDTSEVDISLIDEAGEITGDADYKKLGEILIERGTLTREDMDLLMNSKRRIGEILVEAGLVPRREVESALAEQQLVKEVRQERIVRDQASTIRVPSEKLDRLVDLVSELVTVQARLSQTSRLRADAEMLSISEEVERLTGELHDNAMSIRMVPIGTTFSKFRRLVRDLSEGLGKQVDLTTEGAETELDKTVIEHLNDPLVHLIRNCIDHGIEPPGVRRAAGKSPTGTVHLAARHAGADVLIMVRDDGAGIDTERLRQMAVSKGLATPEAQLTEQEIYSFIFHPGFSMAERVTDVSGRGVGMDVVRRGIESLRGTVEVASALGQGTTITLRIPLTLAIIEGLLVTVGGDYFVLPLSSVEECVELTSADEARAHGRHLVNVRGEMVPYVRLDEKFGMDAEERDRRQVAVLSHEGHRVGFVVDQVVGEHQTVIKSLSRVYKRVRAISGATILGDGTVALILDAGKIIDDAVGEEEVFVHAVDAAASARSGAGAHEPPEDTGDENAEGDEDE
jgi:two-component system chemotaxis sensor kinase CheA